MQGRPPNSHRRRYRQLVRGLAVALGGVVVLRWLLAKKHLLSRRKGAAAEVALLPVPVEHARHRRVRLAGLLGALAVLVLGAGLALYLLGGVHLPFHGSALPPPVRATPPPLKVLSSSPANGARAVGLSSELAVQFSAPLAPGGADPTLSPEVPGSWTLEGPSTLVFQPSTYLPPLKTMTLSLPAGNGGPRGLLGQRLSSSYATSFTVGAPSVLGLQQLLAQLDYLPLRFEPLASNLPVEATHAHSSTAAINGEAPALDEVALDTQPGTFAWRYPNVPTTLAALWRPGVDTALLQGAVMSFQLDHGLDDNGVLTATFWSELLQSVANGEVSTAPYDYLEVSMTLPETLSVWRDGRVIYRTPCNTGIPDAPTAAGSYAVYARYLSTTMTGFNPDGSFYDDPGVPDVAYFNGGDAVHGFPRYSYGFPQSLGCVELPFAAATVVFGYDPIGTVVTIS